MSTENERNDLTLGQIKQAKERLEENICKLLQDFESLVGGCDSVETIRWRRYNGSNDCYGPIQKVELSVELIPGLGSGYFRHGGS